MSGGAGDIAKVAVPLALTAATGGAGAALAPALTGGMAGLSAAQAATLGGALVGAGTGALGSAITGGNPLTGAALGGIGGGIGGYMRSPADAAGSVAADAASGAEAISPELAVADPSLTAPTLAAGDTLGQGDSIGSAFTRANSAMADIPVSRGGSSGIGGMIGGIADSKYALPIAGGLASLATSGGGENQEPLKREERKINNVAPLQREMTAVDPNSFYGIGGARSSFVRANPATVYLADGGSVRDKSDRQINRENAMESLGRLKSIGYPAATRYPGINSAAELIHERYLKDDEYPGTFDQYVVDEYGSDSPVSKAILQNTRKVNYAKGGDVRGIGSMVQGAGDGQSDDIPAQLSDGEFVVSAPVVSALGRGSNAAGAKKLHKMQKTVMKKTYKGSKPPAAGMGIGAMRMA